MPLPRVNAGDEDAVLIGQADGGAVDLHLERNPPSDLRHGGRRFTLEVKIDGAAIS